ENVPGNRYNSVAPVSHPILRQGDSQSPDYIAGLHRSATQQEEPWQTISRLAPDASSSRSWRPSVRPASSHRPYSAPAEAAANRVRTVRSEERRVGEGGRGGGR